ncbi:conserved Plasmodium protein, unknown function [Plasmodium malariae]|uniref:Uncharacterized protein n=1 Tax=Plasmodium malariae TaxID=5858 RepID=A0A1D3TCE1_PLAMA|nr:conserved Plasmodium protein, unknown function [Plasmodium malariae]SCP02537.1 conserved Plasmodium protein, unknown function [Plasmodium malariae]
MHNYMPKSFDEILIHPKDKLRILNFFISLIKFNNDPILCKELESVCSTSQRIDVLNLKNICVILGAPGSGKTTLLKYVCQKLNMRECYYDSELQDHMHFVRNINEEEENRYYYHPYNDFLLYSNCQIGNTEKSKISKVRKEEDSSRNNASKNCKLIAGLVRNNKRSTMERGEIGHIHKMLKLYLGNNSNNSGSNNISGNSSGSNNSGSAKAKEMASVDFINKNFKKEIIEYLVEYNNMNGRIANGFFKLYNSFINILIEFIKIEKNILQESDEEYYQIPLVSSNDSNRIIYKKYVRADQICTKVNRNLFLSNKLKKQISEHCIEANNIEKKFLIDLFVDDNYSEQVITNLNVLTDLHDQININFIESEQLNKLLDDKLTLYNNIKGELNDDFALCNALREELTYLMEKKKVKEIIHTFMLDKNSVFKRQKLNNVTIKEIYESIIFSNISKEAGEDNNTTPINDLLNKEVKDFIELHKSKEIIKGLIENINFKHNLSEYVNIHEKLKKRANRIEMLKNVITKKIEFDLINIANNGLFKNVENLITDKCYSSWRTIDLLIANDMSTYLINNLNLNNTYKGLLMCNAFIGNYLTDIIIINCTLVNYIKGEAMNDFIRINNSIKRTNEGSLRVRRYLLDEREACILTTINYTTEKVDSNFNTANNLYEHIKLLFEGYNDDIKEEVPDSNYFISSELINGNLKFSDKLLKKMLNYSIEIHKLNKKIVSNLVKCNDILEEIISCLNKDSMLKGKILQGVVQYKQGIDKIINLLVPNHFEQKMINFILDTDLYKKFMNIDLKKKREEERKKSYYEEHFISTRAVIIDELPLSELEYSEEFRNSCASSMNFIFNRVNYCKQEYLKHFVKQSYPRKNFECYAIHPMIILINSFEQIKTVNTLLGIDINHSPYVDFIKLKKIHPLYLEKTLSEKYYCRMINLNKNIKQVIKNFSYNCNGDVRSCFNALDFLNRFPDLSIMSLEEINKISLLCQNDIFGFAKKVLHRDICPKSSSKNNNFHSLTHLNFDTGFNSSSAHIINQANGNVSGNGNGIESEGGIGYVAGNVSNTVLYLSSLSVVTTNDSASVADNVKISNTEENIQTGGTTPLNFNKGALSSYTGNNNSNSNNADLVNNIGSTDDETKQREIYMNIFKELDDKADMMSISEKFQVLSLLKENFLFFYNSLSDIARLFSNLSMIDYSFCGNDCSNMLMRKYYDNLSDETTRFINDHFRLTYRYYITCNSTPKKVIGNSSMPNELVEKLHTDLNEKRQEIEYSIQPSCQVRMFFTFKTNNMNKYYHHFSIVRKELYDRYIMIVIKKLTNQNVNKIEDITPKYSFFLRGNYELFSSFFPCYILLIIEYWNNQYQNECNVLNNHQKDNLLFNKIKINQNDGFYFNIFYDIIYHFKPNIEGDKKRNEHISQVISFVETFVTPKFIALFFPSYLKYLADGTKQKQNVKNLLGNQAVSTETYFEMRNLLRLHDMELYNYFFYY